MKNKECKICRKNKIGHDELKYDIPMTERFIGNICKFCENVIRSIIIDEHEFCKSQKHVTRARKKLPNLTEVEWQLYEIQALSRYLNLLAYYMIVKNKTANAIEAIRSDRPELNA